MTDGTDPIDERPPTEEAPPAAVPLDGTPEPERRTIAIALVLVAILAEIGRAHV